MKKTLLTLLLLASALPLLSEVYWLGPGRRSSVGNTEKLAGILRGMDNVLYTSKVNVNSFLSTMKVSAVQGDIEDIILQLRRLKVEKLNISGGTVRFERALPGKMKERFLLISTRKDRPITCFRMTVPEKLPPPGEWPTVLPSLPPGAEITAVTQLDDKSICGEFRNASEPAYVLLRRADSELRHRKMYAASNEISRPSGGKGDIYFNDNAIVWITFDDNGRGTFFYRPRK